MIPDFTPVARYHVPGPEGQPGSLKERYAAFRVKLPAMMAPRETLLCIIATDGQGTGWEHVSVHARMRQTRHFDKLRTPTWDEMCLVKDLFWLPEETVVQFHPRASEYVNNHPHCLHLWRWTGDGPMPQLPPSIFVGVQGGALMEDA